MSKVDITQSKAKQEGHIALTCEVPEYDGALVEPRVLMVPVGVEIAAYDVTDEYNLSIMSDDMLVKALRYGFAVKGNRETAGLVGKKSPIEVTSYKDASQAERDLVNAEAAKILAKSRAKLEVDDDWGAQGGSGLSRLEGAMVTVLRGFIKDNEPAEWKALQEVPTDDRTDWLRNRIKTMDAESQAALREAAIAHLEDVAEAARAKAARSASLAKSGKFSLATPKAE